MSATLAVGIGGVDSSTTKGIWIGTSNGDLQLVARIGEVIGGKLLTGVPQFGHGVLFDLTENDVVWVGNFGSAKAVILSRIIGRIDDAAAPDLR